MYTTYFYTAAEAVVHGYERGTSVRIFELESRRPIWAGTVGEGETVLVPTGAGVFGFVSDKKASILVGTPSSCTAVGYWGRDEDGGFVSDRHFVRLPSSSTSDDNRVVVWATAASRLTVRDRESRALLFQGTLPAGGRWVLGHDRLAALGNHTLDVRSETPTIAVQVYYDEGFTVPSVNGRAAGREFFTYVGRTTEGENDVVLTSPSATARVRVEDLDSHEVLFDGGVEAGTAHAITTHGRYLHVTSDREIGVAVAPFVHYQGGYAEHHFAGGVEGTGIDNDFILTTPQQLWIFSYFENNRVTVEDARNHVVVWQGTLAAGGFQGLQPGQGLYRVRSSGGMSVMGGASTCGGEYSPAGRLFAVDEAVMGAVERVRQLRIEAAAARGVTLSPAAAAAPLSPTEVQRVTRDVQATTGSRVFDAPAVESRMRAMDVH